VAVVAIFLMGATLSDLRGSVGDAELMHLAVGRQIHASGVVSAAFAFPGDHPWINGSWLSDLLVFGIVSLGGFALVGLAKSALTLGTLALALVRARSWGRSPWVTVALAPLVLAALTSEGDTLSARVSLLLLALALNLVDATRGPRRTQAALALAAVLGLAGELDPGFARVFLACGLWVLGELGARSFESDRRPDARPALAVAAALVAGALSFTVNPFGFEALTEPFAYATDLRWNWASLRSPQTEAMPLIEEVFVLGGFALTTLGTTLAAGEALPTLAFAALAVPAMTGQGALALVAVPLFARGLDVIVARALELNGRSVALLERLGSPPPIRHAWAVGLGGLWLLLALAQATPWGPTRLLDKPLGPDDVAAIESGSTAPKDLPVLERTRAALDGARAERGLPGHVWSDAGTWGALLWHNRPEGPAGISQGAWSPEGRAYLLSAQARIQAGVRGWEESFAQDGVDLALVWRRTPIAHLLEESGWRIAHDNGALRLFVRPGSEAARKLDSRGG
jgi:hypothetical protein